MIIASGYLEVDSVEELQKVTAALEQNTVEVTGSKDDRIVFLIERETEGAVKKDLEALKDIAGVRSVYLSYFSIEGSDSIREGTGQ